MKFCYKEPSEIYVNSIQLQYQHILNYLQAYIHNTTFAVCSETDNEVMTLLV